MANYPMNIWVIMNDDEFEKFTYTGGKVIYIAEELEPKFSTHPAIITAGALLPPLEAIQAELDGNWADSTFMYENYLQSQEADIYISIMIAAAIKGNPIGLMFGRDEKNMRIPNMLLDYLFKAHGMVLGIQNKLQPYIVEQYMPGNLAKLYNLDIIDYQTFMMIHPDLPIHNMAIPKMAYNEHPPVIERDHKHYYEYFEEFRKTIRRNGGTFFIDPMEGI